MLKKVEKAVKVLELAKELKLTRDVSHLTRANSVGPSEDIESRSGHYLHNFFDCFLTKLISVKNAAFCSFQQLSFYISLGPLKAL